MRISDWSSDVCSSDLDSAIGNKTTGKPKQQRKKKATSAKPSQSTTAAAQADAETWATLITAGLKLPRKSLVLGKRVSVRVDRGGCSTSTKKITDIVIHQVCTYLAYNQTYNDRP